MHLKIKWSLDGGILQASASWGKMGFKRLLNHGNLASMVLILVTASTAAQTTNVTNANNGTPNTVPIYTGTATLGNSPLAVSGNDVETAKFNGVVSPCGFAGATADVKLQAAINSISAGTIDARCFGNTNQTIAATVTWGWTASVTGGAAIDATSIKTIVFDPATTFTPSSNTTNMFWPGRAGIWKDLHIHLGPLATSYAGNIVQYAADQYGNTFPSTSPSLKPGYDGDGLFIDDSAVNSLFTAIAIVPGAGWAQFLHFNNIQNNAGGLNTILMNTTSTGWINQNTFTNLVDACNGGTHVGVSMIPNGTGNSGANAQISGNLFDNFAAEYQGGSGCKTWNIANQTSGDNKVYVDTNYFTHYAIWDASNLTQFVDQLTASGSTNSFRNSVCGPSVNTLNWSSWGGADASFCDPMGQWIKNTGNLKLSAPTLFLNGLWAAGIVSSPGQSAAYWQKIGTWSGAVSVNSMTLLLQTANGAYSRNNRQGLAIAQLQAGPGGAAPNLAGITAWVLGNNDIAGIQAVQTGCGSGCTPSPANGSWDIYVQLSSYSNIIATPIGDANAAWSPSYAVLASCASLPSTCLSTPANGYLTGSVYALQDNSGNINATSLAGNAASTIPTKSGTPTSGAGVCWKSPSVLGTCSAGTWPNCSVCN
jgi:hypothetical protein